MTSCDLDTSIPDWLIDHPSTQIVFESLGIDGSCGGKSLGYACVERGLDARKVLEQLHRHLSCEKPT